MSPARATSSAVERWIPYEGEGGGGGEREERGERRRKGRRKGGRVENKEKEEGERNITVMKSLSTGATKLGSPLAAVFLFP